MAAAAGARTAVLTTVGDDEIGDAIIRRVVDLGVDPGLIRRSSRPNGAYLLHGDLTGHRQFSYWRNGSAAVAVCRCHAPSTLGEMTRTACTGSRCWIKTNAMPESMAGIVTMELP